ncbi:MAG: hypothetical protein KC776_08095 [Myxococcales bacterium]|nr:hypothetical protein [Myxococcales bacterium]MCB9576045.1 hypothetical protein [Polyangiaceae bacterium]
MNHRKLRLALVASLLLHAAALGAMALRPASSARVQRAVELPESWGGDTFEVDEVTRRGAASKRVEPTPPEPEPKAEPQPKTEPQPKVEPSVKPKLAPTTKPKPPAEPAPNAEPDVKPSTRASKPKPMASAGADAGSTQPSTAATGSGDGGARYGAEGLPPGVRRLAKAFTRAVTAATNRDPFWDEQPIGLVGSARLEIELDADGRIRATNTGKDELAPALRHLVDRTVLLLRTGRFALASGLSAGKEVFRIEVRLSRGAEAEDYDNPRDTVSLGFDPPGPSTPGRAYFVHASGLRFEAKVVLESSSAEG